ncbi:hypothetical protein J6590_107890, partial [Homalodisca vitripennis]
INNSGNKRYSVVGETRHDERHYRPPGIIRGGNTVKVLPKVAVPIRLTQIQVNFPVSGFVQVLKCMMRRKDQRPSVFSSHFCC